MDILKAIKERHSVRRYTGKPLGGEALARLEAAADAAGMEAALLAPTAMNQQKFSFVLEADDSVTARTAGGPFARLDLGIVRYHFEVASGHDVVVR